MLQASRIKNHVVSSKLSATKNLWAVIGRSGHEHEIVSLHESRYEAEAVLMHELETNEEYVSMSVLALC